jgi:hypothetical protein
MITLSRVFRLQERIKPMMSYRSMMALPMLALCIALRASVAQNVAATAPAPAAPLASSQVGPALAGVKQAVQQLSVDKWKAPKTVKDATLANLASIRKDVDQTMPGLLSAADAAPNSVAAMIPVSRNMSALYDVVLRVAVVADAAAPEDQANAIEAAMNRLDDARRGFADHLQVAADTQERHVTDMQKKLSAPPPPPPPAPVCPPPPAPAKKKPAPKPATTTPPPV